MRDDDNGAIRVRYYTEFNFDALVGVSFTPHLVWLCGQWERLPFSTIKRLVKHSLPSWKGVYGVHVSVQLLKSGRGIVITVTGLGFCNKVEFIVAKNGNIVAL